MTRRLERVNSLLREEISDLLRLEIKDPRLGGFVTITDVATSPDLKHATVFVSRLGDSVEKKDTLAALAAARGYLHRALTKRIQMRHVPELVFEWDDSIERGARLSRLMDRIISEDAGTSPTETPP